MLLYTIKSWEEIFEAGEDASGAAGENGLSAGEIEIKQQGRSFLVQPLPGGQMKINRIISTDPLDYLNPDWQ
ncbi:MAG TPA: YlzJ-like family protein, partial [Bacillota bacterium]|nr:YlzJ-like family protein [Bacillota bacterium]